MTHDTAAPRLPTAPPDPEATRSPCHGIVIGTLIDAREAQAPVVAFEGHEGEVVRREALCAVPLDSRAVGHPVVLMFVDGDLDRPIVTGRIDPGIVMPKKTRRTRTLVLDGRELALEADAALTLRCGKSSITLTREGRIILRGTNLVSHASGVNRIRGGTIELN